MTIYFKYLLYILKHKWFVLIAGWKVGGITFTRCIVHDRSKFYPSEFFPYARFFFEKSKLKSHTIKLGFDVAWNHHQKRNRHHWQYWILQNYTDTTHNTIHVLPMPKKYAREMVADWMGAGRAINGRWEVKEWYKNKKDAIILHEDTRKLVEDILGKLQ